MKKIMLAALMSLGCNVFAAEMTKSEMNTEKLNVQATALPAPSAASVSEALPSAFYEAVKAPVNLNQFETLRKIFEEKAGMPVSLAKLSGVYAGRAYSRYYPDMPQGALLSCFIQPTREGANGPLFEQNGPKWTFEAVSIRDSKNPLAFDNYDPFKDNAGALRQMKERMFSLIPSSDGRSLTAKERLEQFTLKTFTTDNHVQYIVVHHVINEKLPTTVCEKDDQGKDVCKRLPGKSWEGYEYFFKKLD